MCGVCGIINFNDSPVKVDPIKKMMKVMKYRGPDDEGVFVSKNVGLGNVRLSIIDLSSDGRQPMISSDGRYVLTYNGEIYNYIELKDKLSDRYKFKTKTDTEVILYAYDRWGKECLQYFNGMFAFALYDKKTGEMFIARDRFGIKPLYYYLDDEKMIFASEVSPILKVISGEPTPNNQIIYDYLIYNRTNHSEGTFFSEIRKLQHSHYMVVKNGKVSIKRWYDLHLAVQKSQKFKNPDEMRDVLVEAVKLQMRSDVPVGVCLSGGLDSSSITSIVLKNFLGRRLNTFSAIYGENHRSNEIEFINEYNEYKGKSLNMYFTKPAVSSFLTDVEKFVNVMQEPVVNTSSYAEYKVYEKAKGHVTVLLNGQGIDEIMAGYLYLFGYYYRDLLKDLRIQLFLKELFFDLKKHRTSESLLALVYFTVPKMLKERINLYTCSSVNKDFLMRYGEKSNILEDLFGSENLNQAFFDHLEYKFEHHLIWGDRSSMAASIEVRFPFLDHNFVEKTLLLNGNEIIKNGTSKFYFREAMRGILPEKIRLREQKVGFETPEDIWFRDKRISKYIKDIVLSKEFSERGYFNKKKVARLLEEHASGNVNVSSEIWKWVNLELWFRNFID